MESSSLTRDGTWTPCLGNSSLSPWTPREGQEEENLEEIEGVPGDEEEGLPFIYFLSYMFKFRESIA